MKTDAIVIGAELDGLLAAARLCELGYSVRMFSNGAGSLHYSPDGLHVLGYLPSDESEMITMPLNSITELDMDHPYQKLGVEKVSNALDWYIELVSSIHYPIELYPQNKKVVSPAGQFVPACGISRGQSTLENLNGKNIVLVGFEGHRDFPCDLISVELQKQGFQITIIETSAPGLVLENAAIASAFDTLGDPAVFFSALKKQLPLHTDLAVFPAIMGMTGYNKVLSAAEQALEIPCLELPTLPPSVPGMRLEHCFRNHLKKSRVQIHTGAALEEHTLESGGVIVLRDSMGHQYKADVVIISNGGVLMGGVEIDSYGQTREKIFGLTTYQSTSLKAETVADFLNALHHAGVETDDRLRPRKNNTGVLPNMFVTGRSLSHWNSAVESSNEGVCISTGWAAAEYACNYLEEMKNV